MDTGKTIRKVLFVGLWLAIGAGMLTLLIAAMGKEEKNTCKDYTITIKGVKGKEFFLDEGDIQKLLQAGVKGKIKGQSKSAFDLKGLEELLEGNRWVKDAQLYFDNRDVLHVSVLEREPIARVITTGGRSFYLDETKEMMQLSDKLSAKLPVFTGFPDRKIKSAADSLLLEEVVKTAQLINRNLFWASQVAQIDIDLSCGQDCRQFTMIPEVGNHTIRLGDGENMEQKLNRLYLFYKEVLSKTGFAKYKAIDVSYAGQVIGVKSENPKIDSVQLRRNVEALLRQINEAEKLSEADAKLPSVPVVTTPVMKDTMVSVGNKEVPKPVATTTSKPDERNSSDNKPVKKSVKNDSKPAEGKRSPKAVMPKREN